ncbi:MAG: hypothetical protein HC837_13195 [Chloroflexaceae bacterium]|nr:hypothetical protein [Chloroflexaceae bacterium]
MMMIRILLQTRLTLLTLAIVMPLIIFLAIFLMHEASEQIEHETNEKIQFAHEALAVHTQTWLSLNVASLHQLLLHPDMVRMERSKQEPLLRNMILAHPHMYLASTVNLQGDNVARSDNEGMKAYGDRDWFQQARAGSPVVFQSLIGRTSAEPALVVSMPIRNAAGDIVGVGMFASTLVNLSDQVEALRLLETGFAYVIDQHNMAVAHPDLDTVQGLYDLSDTPPVVALRQGHQGLYQFTDEHGRHGGLTLARWRTVGA